MVSYKKILYTYCNNIYKIQQLLHYYNIMYEPFGGGKNCFIL